MVGCDATAWSTGDDLPLTTALESRACVVHDPTFQWLWVSVALLAASLLAHASTKLPWSLEGLATVIKRGASHTLPLWFAVVGINGLVSFAVKAARLSRYSDPEAAVEIVFFAVAIASFAGPSVWLFLYSILVPFMAALPNFASLEVKLKRSFWGCGLVCAASTGTIVLLQLAIDTKDRVQLCTALFVAIALIGALIFAVLGIGGHKLLVLIDQSRSVSTGAKTSREQDSARSLAKLRRKLLLMILAIEGVAVTICLSCLGVLLVPTLRDRTWLVLPVVVSSAMLGGHVALFFAPSSSRMTKSSDGSMPRSSGIKPPAFSSSSRVTSSSLLASSSSSRSKSSAYKVTPASASRVSSTNDLLNPVAILARSQLAVAESILNKDEFLPPQEQPRAKKLEWVARLLQDDMFKKCEHTMNVAVAGVIEEHFIPVAQAHFAECVEQARDMIPEMRDRYHGLRKGHLAIYQDTLDQIREENAFPTLQKRSDKLVEDCKTLNRRKKQKATSICDLFNGAEAVSIRYDALMASIASKTGTKFHSAPRKGLVRICEKLALASEWQPERILDITRGALECPSFSMMISVLRLLQDMDCTLKITGETGGIEEEICITRSKGRFGQPTSGGWADIMINFYFKDDEEEWAHICEIQLVHAQLYNVRKNMGAHKNYNEFRAALELLEKVGTDPEEGSDAAVLEALVWKRSTRRRTTITPAPMMEVPMMQVLEKMATLEAQNEKMAAQMEKMSAALTTLVSRL